MYIRVQGQLISSSVSVYIDVHQLTTQKHAARLSLLGYKLPLSLSLSGPCDYDSNTFIRRGEQVLKLRNTHWELNQSDPSSQAMPLNITSIKTSSNGVWQGDNPLNYAFPLLIVQIILVLFLSRSLALLLKPLRQPKVIAEIVGGILLGPSALGRNEAYLQRIFPAWSTPVLESVASIGLLFFLFLVGLELDINSIRRSGRRALSIAAAGITLPFVGGVGVAFILRKTVKGADQAGYAPFLVFMGVALSITAFPVLARILAELKLLTTQVGETAMAAAAFNDVVAWVLLALAVALSGDGNTSGGGHHKSPLVSVWVLLSGIAFVAFMFVVVKPVMTWMAHRCSPEHEAVDEAYICVTLAGVLVSGFVTDLIGIHSIFGSFVFGLTIPKDGAFADRLMERIEDFVAGLLLPLYFASSGLKTNIAKISGVEAWGLLVLVIFTACAGKILGTFVVALSNKIPAREAMALGLLMNTKGLVELIVLNIGKERKVLNDEMFAILVLMALFTTFMATPTVMAVYKPARRVSHRKHRRNSLQKSSFSSISDFDELQSKELRILACVHGPGNVPSLINLIESTRGGAKKSPLKLYIMHLVELTERSSSIVMVQRARKNGLPFPSCRPRADSRDPISLAFEAYGQLGQVKVRPMTAISALTTMHEDVCRVAEDKSVTMLILSFHKRERHDGDTAADDMGPAWRAVNQRILMDAPCSTAVLIDRGLGGNGVGDRGGPSQTSVKVSIGVGVVLFGGPDDRKALELGCKMAEHPEVKVTVIRFIVTSEDDPNSKSVVSRPSTERSMEKSSSFANEVVTDREYYEREKGKDEKAIAALRKRWKGTVEYVERAASVDVVEEVIAVGRSGKFELLVVGKGQFPTSFAVKVTPEYAELGPLGDVLASSSNRVVSSVLVIQHHAGSIVRGNNEVSSDVSKVVDGGDDASSSSMNAAESSV